MAATATLPSVGHAGSPPVPVNKQLLTRPPLTLPNYRRECECYMVHIGVGGFHRAHQAHYMDRLLHHYHRNPSERPPEVYGICGMGLRPRMSDRDPGDELMAKALRQQDSLYTLVLRGGRGTEATVIGAMMEYILAPDDYAAAIERLADPTTRIISLTVTEKGYCQTVQGDLDLCHPAIQHDLQHPSTPQSAHGIITASLRLRHLRGQPGVTVLSCDNLPENGDTVKRVLRQFIEASSPELLAWVDHNVSFPNSMVDRITPFTDEHDKESLRLEFGLDDQWPVFAEHFCQWVIEDHFISGRPELEKVDALFVPDVRPYENMKLRLLNGGHSALAYLSYLAGYTHVDAAMADPLIREFVGHYLYGVRPCIPPVPGVNLSTYIAILNQRFANPNIKDKVARVAEDGSKKLRTTMTDPILELTAAGHSTRFVALAVAGFIRFMTGEDMDHQPITVIRDPVAEDLRGLCKASCTTLDVQAPLRLVLGPEVAALAGFEAEVQAALGDLQTIGVRETLTRWMAGHDPTSR